MGKAEIVLDFDSKNELLTGLFNVQKKLFASDIDSKVVVIGNGFVCKFREV